MPLAAVPTSLVNLVSVASLGRAHILALWNYARELPVRTMAFRPLPTERLSSWRAAQWHEAANKVLANHGALVERTGPETLVLAVPRAGGLDGVCPYFEGAER